MPHVGIQPAAQNFSCEQAQASAVCMVQELQDVEVSKKQGLHRMQVWLQDKPLAANAALCLLYGLSWYLVKDSCFADIAPLDEQSFWFMACGPDEDHTKLPSPSAELALLWEQAVQALQLKTRFFGAENN